MGTLVLIRHAQASYGQADFDRLSPRGIEQARALGAFLTTARLDRLYRGPHVRHQQTATHAAESADGIAGTSGSIPEPTELDELAEYPAFAMLQHFMPRLVAEDPRFAQLTQTPTRELANAAFRTVMDRWMRDEWHADEVERVGTFAQRVRRGFDRIVGEAASGARIGVVTSAGPIGVAVGLVFGASELHMVRTSLVVRNASVSELKFRSREFAWHPERVSLLSFNSTHHLPSELHTEY
jgi:broad specificity phosphatase PhoE